MFKNEDGIQIVFPETMRGVAVLIASVLLDDFGTSSACVRNTAITNTPAMFLPSAVFNPETVGAKMKAAIELAGALLQVAYGTCMSSIPATAIPEHVPDDVAAAWVTLRTGNKLYEDVSEA